MKPMTRSASFPKRGLAIAVLAVLAVAGTAIRSASAQVDEDEPNRLVGSLRVAVNVMEPQNFPAFPALMTFHAGDTMMQSRPYFVPQFGALETTHHGAWKRITATHFAVNDFALAQGAPGNAALNGVFFGTDNVTFSRCSLTMAIPLLRSGQVWRSILTEI